MVIILKGYIALPSGSTETSASLYLVSLRELFHNALCKLFHTLLSYLVNSFINGCFSLALSKSNGKGRVARNYY